MSTLSKVLIVLLVLLAVAHSAVLLAYLSQQQSYKAFAEAKDEELKSARATWRSEAIASDQTLEQLRKERDVLVAESERIGSLLVNVQRSLAGLELRAGALDVEKGRLAQQVANLSASLRLAQEAQKHLSSQVDAARDAASQFKAENAQLERQVAGLDMDVRALTAEVQRKKELIFSLQSEIRKASGRTAAQARPAEVTFTPAAAVARQPIKGRIKEVNLAEKMATVNVGSIAGVSAGMTLTISDNELNNEYVAVLKVTSVLRDQAIGTIELAAKPVEVGDQVTTSLLN